MARGVLLVAISESQRRAVAKYNAANYDRIEVKLPKGRKHDVEAAAKAAGQSINGYINALIRCNIGVDVETWERKHKADGSEQRENSV